tara:strand:- start:6804 stop:7064 length:261 start_codon:yes stop_codon:yes gene_type:complete
MNVNKMKTKFCAIAVAVVINLTLPQLVKLVATENQKNPTDMKTLSFFDKIMHMFVHHANTPLTSSLIVAVIVGLSVCLGPMLCKLV